MSRAISSVRERRPGTAASEMAGRRAMGGHASETPATAAGSLARRPVTGGTVDDEMAGEHDELPPPVPAATVVVVRDGPHGIETLMLHRAAAGAFGGMWVFPGGKVDPGDVDP